MNITYHIEDIEQVARQIIAHSSNQIFLFNASMGAGKTTLITKMCQQLGVIDEISSPTFSIINEYQGKNDTVFHFDLYRIENDNELIDIGIEDYLDQSAYLFIEWPERILPFLDHYTAIKIDIIDEHTRALEVLNK